MEEVNMRKRIIALLMLVCMTVSNISPAYAYIGGKITKTDILQNKDDTYILENYAKSLKEAQDVERYNLLNNKEGKYKITMDADADWIDEFCSSSYLDGIDDGLGNFYYRGGATYSWDGTEELTDKDGKKYMVFTMYNIDYDSFAKMRKELLEVRDKFLATMPNLDEMSDYEKVLGILSFMSYIKYGFDEKGNTIDDAYTTLFKCI